MTEVKIKSRGIVLSVLEHETPSKNFDSELAKTILQDFFTKNNLNSFKLIRFVYGWDGDIVIYCDMPISDAREFKLNRIIG